MEPLHRIFKALADPNRLRIFNVLLEHSFCVCELEALLGLPQPLISRHLAYLRGAGLVRDRRQGMRVQYSVVLDTAVQQALAGFLRQLLPFEEGCRLDIENCRRKKELCCVACRGSPALSSSDSHGETL